MVGKRAWGPGQALGNALLKTHCPGHEPTTRRPAVPSQSGINVYLARNLMSRAGVNHIPMPPAIEGVPQLLNSAGVGVRDKGLVRRRHHGRRVLAARARM